MAKDDAISRVREGITLQLDRERAELSSLQKELDDLQLRFSVQRVAVMQLEKVLGWIDAETSVAQAVPKRSEPRQPPGAVADAIMAQFTGTRFGAMNAADIAARTGMKPASVRAALKKLVDDGKLISTVDGYDLPPGKKAVQPATSRTPPAAQPGGGNPHPLPAEAGHG